MKNIAFLWAVLSISTIGLAQDKPSFAGNWELDVTQSDFGSEPAPKSLAGTIFKDTPQMLSYRVHGVDDKGKPFWYSWSGPEDGSMHRIIVDGKPNGQQGVKKEQDGTIIRHGDDPRDGSSFDARDSLSADGNTETSEETDKLKDGTINKQKVIFRRGASSPHLQ
jgi:hypothetical protein